MKDYKELLKKFWAGNATELEKLQLHKLIVEQEVNAHVSPVQNSDYTEEELLEPEEAQKILTGLHQEINSRERSYRIPSRSKIVKLLKPVAAVAAVLIAVLLVVLWPFHKTNNRVAKTEAILADKIITNNQSSILLVTLTDSSVVSIYPGSSISYKEAFNTGTERLIHLKGKADFKVQHNDSKPFRVIAEQIMTTDIGTVFSIDALQPDIVKVILKEGSVQVEALPGSNIAMNRKMQQPGEELKINLATSEVVAFEPLKKTDVEKAMPVRKNSIPAKQQLTFNRTPLAEVFAQLAQREKVTINFNGIDVEGLTFTGKIEPKDPLELSLDVICGLNGLSYTNKQGVIDITKSK